MQRTSSPKQAMVIKFMTWSDRYALLNSVITDSQHRHITCLAPYMLYIIKALVNYCRKTVFYKEFMILTIHLST